MKSIYTNAPCNKQKKSTPSFKAIAALSCVIALMVAIKVFYAPEESMEDVAAMANSVMEPSETEAEETEPLQTSVIYLSPTAYSEKREEANCFFPLKGTLTSAFAERDDPFDRESKEFHKGIDIAPQENEKIIAYTEGSVSEASYDPSYGSYIKLSHSDGRESLYAHCSSLLVKQGDKVRAGQIIAIPGRSGDATGVHLHFELRINGKCVDPMEYFK